MSDNSGKVLRRARQGLRRTVKAGEDWHDLTKPDKSNEDMLDLVDRKERDAKSGLGSIARFEKSR